MRQHHRPLLQALLLLAAASLWPGSSSALQPDLSSLSSLPLHTASPATVSKALQQVDSKSRPVQYAVHAALPLTLADGLWDEAENGVARWRSRVASPGALGLSLSFSHLQLPAGAELWLYDDAGQLLQGPYTQADIGSLGRLWTALVPGASAVVELRTPTAARDQVELQIDRLSHAFIDISKSDALVSAKSESCNVDVVCSDGNAWRNPIRSVALITIDGNVMCSGELLNNLRRNRDPLFITANHCEISTQNLAASVVFYWNYQTAICGATPSGSLSQSQSGASLLAGDVGSDFSLLRLNRAPNSTYKVFYSGWDASGSTPGSGVAIHHPNGDEKRISTYSSPANRESVCIDTGLLGCTRRVDAWQVNWTRGSTAPGSSGGGLWNQDGRLVGTLSGGNASCSNPNGDDYFARFASGYTAGLSASTQLKAWLDPDNTGVTAIDGLDSSGSTAVPGIGTGSSGSVSGGGGALSPLLLGLLMTGAMLRLSRRLSRRHACRAEAGD